MKLYGACDCPNVQKVRAVAFELSLELTFISVDIQAGQHQTRQFLLKNPNGKLPVLEHGDFVLWESNAIVYYLASLDPSGRLLPTDDRGRARVDQWLFWQTAHLGPAVRLVVCERVNTGSSAEEHDPCADAVAVGLMGFDRFARVLDGHLSDEGYIAGSLSAADFALASCFSAREPAGLDLAPFPHIQTWLARIESRASWKLSLLDRKVNGQ